MNKTLGNKPAAGGQNSSNAFELAKKALGFVGQYRTPPTPEVYEVWYRYAEGLSKSLDERMAYLIDVVGSISTDELNELRKQFLSSNKEARANQSISRALANEIANLKSLVGDQISANDGFNESISTAKSSLDTVSFDDEDIRNCIHTLSECTSEISDRLKETSQQLEESQQQVNTLKSQLDEVRVESLTDPLTGLGNRRFLREQLQNAVKVPEKVGVTFLVMIDLDNFKDVNDSFGHIIGDEALAFVASEIRRLSGRAAVSRYGGDEFCILHQLENPIDVHHFAERIRESLASLRFTSDSGDVVGPITVSVGVARLRSLDTVQQWVARVDSLTYSAKASGKNFVMVERDLAAV